MFVCLDTWRKDVKVLDIKDAINAAAPGKLRVTYVSQVSLIYEDYSHDMWVTSIVLLTIQRAWYQNLWNSTVTC